MIEVLLWAIACVVFAAVAIAFSLSSFCDSGRLRFCKVVIAWFSFCEGSDRLITEQVSSSKESGSRYVVF